MHTDVTTKYLGLELRSPLVVGACPLTLMPETVRELTIAGAGAVVLPSLLQEQVVRRMMDRGSEPSGDERRVEAAGTAMREDNYNGGVDAYLRTISLLKRHTGIPIIAKHRQPTPLASRRCVSASNRCNRFSCMVRVSATRRRFSASRSVRITRP